MKNVIRVVAVCAVLACSGATWAQKGETVRIALIEGLSGSFGNVGQNQLKSWQFLAETSTGQTT